MRIAALILAVALGATSAAAQVIAVVGDTQTWSTRTLGDGPSRWIETNRALCAMKPAAVVHVGDIVETTRSASEWRAARDAFAVLRSCGLLYAAPVGNHDFLWPTSLPPEWTNHAAFAAEFPPLAYSRAPSGNAWIQFLAPGLVLGVLPFMPSAADVGWLTQSLAAVTADAVLVQHEGVDPTNGGWRYSPAFSQVIAARGKQIVGVIGGHFTSADRVQFRSLSPGHGFSLFSNWQLQWVSPADAFHGWVTFLERRGGQWCVSTRNLLTGAAGKMEPSSCV